MVRTCFDVQALVRACVCARAGYCPKNRKVNSPRSPLPALPPTPRRRTPPRPYQARYTDSFPHYIALPGLTRVFCIALFARGAAGFATTLPFELSIRFGGILRAPDRATLFDCRVGWVVG